jgi:hypothetical protein
MNNTRYSLAWLIVLLAIIFRWLAGGELCATESLTS